jgi:hypothetical protein
MLAISDDHPGPRSDAPGFRQTPPRPARARMRPGHSTPGLERGCAARGFAPVGRIRVLAPSRPRAIRSTAQIIQIQVTGQVVSLIPGATGPSARSFRRPSSSSPRPSRPPRPGREPPALGPDERDPRMRSPRDWTGRCRPESSSWLRCCWPIALVIAAGRSSVAWGSRTRRPVMRPGKPLALRSPGEARMAAELSARAALRQGWPRTARRLSSPSTRLAPRPARPARRGQRHGPVPVPATVDLVVPACPAA